MDIQNILSHYRDRGGIFTWRAIDEENYLLSNRATKQDYPFRYRSASLYKKSGSYKIESSWTGSVEEFMALLLPKIETLRWFLDPTEESFESKPAADEHDRGETTYCEEYQVSKYHCRIAKAYDLVFLFVNYGLTDVESKQLPEPLRQMYRQIFRRLFMEK